MYERAALAPGARAASRYHPAVTSKVRICAVALLVAPLVGACGSGGDDGLVSGAKAGYVARIDPICTELQGKVGELGENPGQQAADIEAAVMRMREIQKPREDSERADLYIAAMENLYLSLQDVDQSRRVNDQPRAQRALEGARTNNETAAKAARDYGMVVCGRTL